MWRLLIDAALEWIPLTAQLTQRSQAVAGLLVDPRLVLSGELLPAEASALVTSMAITLVWVRLGLRPDWVLGGVALLGLGVITAAGALMTRLELLQTSEFSRVGVVEGAVAGIIQGVSMLGFGGSGVSVAALTAMGVRLREALIVSSAAGIPVALASGVGWDSILPLAASMAGILAASRALETVKPTTISLAISVPVVVANAGSIRVLLDRRLYYDQLTERVTSWVRRWGPSGLILAMVVQSVISPIPADAILVAAGALGMDAWTVGVVGGIGSALGAMANFYIARLAGRPFVERVFRSEVLDVVDRWFARWGPLAVVIARLIPFSPIDLISYAAGLTGMNPLHFFAANLVALIPRAALFGYIGNLLSRGKVWPVVLLLVVILGSAAAYAARGRLRRLVRGRGEG